MSPDSPATVQLADSWRVLRQRYEVLLVEHLSLEGPLRRVAIHALQRGKRLRPLLAELLGRSLGAPAPAVEHVAIAVEYLHTASILLDDLPCMDDASERRGRPTSHVQFSEADAILTSVALVSRSYAILLMAPVDDGRGMALLASETVAGSMALGQATELGHGVGSTPEAIARVHEQKTASLFALVAHLVAIAAGAKADDGERAATFASALGCAYQIVDDIEDRDRPGEAGANLARAVRMDRTRVEADARLGEARRLAADLDASGQLGALVAWLELRLEMAARVA
jgi:geranylgeranyl diphosphate synthase type II